QVRRVYVTPLRVVCRPEEPEMSNRILRSFPEHADRFLRVSLVDEHLGRLPMIDSGDGIHKRARACPQSDTTFVPGCPQTCVLYSALVHRLQLREHSCWFYAETSKLRAGKIRGWVGNLSNITVVGKHAARLGQTLSCTTATVRVPQHRQQLVQDKECGEYMFTDGCGMMSEGLAR
ncbi:unnamed protein product, partial [Choristocarpus tenellus]